MSKRAKNLSKTVASKRVISASNRLFANVRFASFEKPIKSIALISANKNEGKSTISLSLAKCIAENGYRVLLIDADVFQRTLSRTFSHNHLSLHNILNGESSIENAIVQTPVNNMYFLNCANEVRSIADLVNSEKFLNIYNILRANFDYLIFDTPPILPSVDGSIVSSVCDTTILVVRENKTTFASLKATLEQVKLSKSKILGTVLTFSSKSNKYYYYDKDY